MQTSVLGCSRLKRRFSQDDRRTGMADDKKKRSGADRARIALSQPYEVSYWSKKFKVTPARLKAAVAAVGHSSKNVGAYLTGSKKKKKKSAKKTSKKTVKTTAKKRAKKKAA